MSMVKLVLELQVRRDVDSRGQYRYRKIVIIIINYKAYDFVRVESLECVCLAHEVTHQSAYACGLMWSVSVHVRVESVSLDSGA